MDSGAVIAELGDGRVHAQHGPIDLVITIDTDEKGHAGAMRSLQLAFPTLLAGLVVDLDMLRSATSEDAAGSTTTSRRMVAATLPLATLGFITPMAAVAGSVADTICEVMWDDQMKRLIVNNGGDIALRLSEGTSVTVALANVTSGAVNGGVRIDASQPIRGIATSGRGGRSLTMGIADSVTVFAGTAASADACATFIASGIDAPDSATIKRCAASDQDANSDLGERLVVVEIGDLTYDEKLLAMDRGVSIANDLRGRGLLVAAAMKVGDVEATVGPAASLRSVTAMPDNRNVSELATFKNR